jgi:hypothetical protein
VGAPADVHDLRARRVLRQLAESTCHQALPVGGAPLIQSFEPGEDWWWCFVDELAFELDGAPSFSYS